MVKIVAADQTVAVTGYRFQGPVGHLGSLPASPAIVAVLDVSDDGTAEVRGVLNCVDARAELAEPRTLWHWRRQCRNTPMLAYKDTADWSADDRLGCHAMIEAALRGEESLF